MTTWSPLYSTGTVAVANGGTTVTGVATNWSTAGIQAGDQFKALGLMTTITAVTDNTHLAVTAWPGTTLGAGSNYEVVRLSDADRLIAANAALAQSLVPNLTALGALSGVADQMAYFNGAGTMALTGLTSQARTFNAAADGPTARAAIAAAGPASGRIENLSLTASVGANALTMAVKGQDGNNPSATNPVYVAMRSATAGNGGWNLRTLAAALSLVIPSSATLGHTSATAGPIYWYMQDNGGTLELAASSTDYGDSFIGSSTTISSGATSASVIYATTGRSNVAMHKIGASTDTQTTAGTWTAVPSALAVEPLGGAQSEYFKTLKTAADAAGAQTTLGISTFIKTLLDDTTAAVARATLGSTTVGDAVFIAASAAAGRSALGVGASGSFTPVLKFGGATTGITYGTQVGQYIDFGSLCFAIVEIVLTSKGSATGAATIDGLPFSATGTGGFVPWFYSLSLTGVVQGAVSGTAIVLRQSTTTAPANLADTNFSNTSSIWLWGFFPH